MARLQSRPVMLSCQDALTSRPLRHSSQFGPVQKAEHYLVAVSVPVERWADLLQSRGDPCQTMAGASVQTCSVVALRYHLQAAVPLVMCDWDDDSGVAQNPAVAVP